MAAGWMKASSAVTLGAALTACGVSMHPPMPPVPDLAAYAAAAPPPAQAADSLSVAGVRVVRRGVYVDVYVRPATPACIEETAMVARRVWFRDQPERYVQLRDAAGVPLRLLPVEFNNWTISHVNPATPLPHDLPGQGDRGWFLQTFMFRTEGTLRPGPVSVRLTDAVRQDFPTAACPGTVDTGWREVVAVAATEAGRR